MKFSYTLFCFLRPHRNALNPEIPSLFSSLPLLQLHSADVGDGYDWGRLNLHSVTEESRLDDFLHTAQLAGTEFTAGGYSCMRHGLVYSKLHERDSVHAHVSCLYTLCPPHVYLECSVQTVKLQPLTFISSSDFHDREAEH